MVELTRSRVALALAGTAAGLLALSSALAVVAYAVLSPSGTSPSGLATASDWVGFGGAFTAFAAVGAVAWGFVLADRYGDLWEVGSAAAATLLLAIGSLVAATEVSSTSSQAANVTEAIGFGMWAAIAIAVAAVRSVAESKHPGRRKTAGYWLAAAAGLVLVAIAAGLPEPQLLDSTPGIVAGVVGALGIAVIAVTLGVARSRQVIRTGAFSVVAAGLGLLAAWEVGVAVTSPIVFSPSVTLTTARVGLSAPRAIAAVGYVVLAAAAWRRLDEVPAHLALRAPVSGAAAPYWPPGTYPPAGPGQAGPGAAWPSGHAPAPPPWPPAPPAPGTTGWAAPAPPARTQAVHCGVALPEGASFCPRCGTPVPASPPA